MNEMLAKINKENKICYLMGDFNIDLLKSESCDYANRFTEKLFTTRIFHSLQNQHELHNIQLH